MFMHSCRRTTRHRILAGLVPIVSACLVLGLFGGSASAAQRGRSVQKGVGSYTIFNKPQVGPHSDYRIEADLVKRIEQTPAGETIQSSMATMGRTPVAQALSDAQSRGVHVRLALDGGEYNSNPDNPARKILRHADLDQLVYCHDPDSNSTSCVSTRENAIDHDKFFMFSRTGDLHDVAWIASYNINETQNRWFNHATVLYGRSGLYHQFQRHMHHILNQDKNDDYYNSDVGTYSTDDQKMSVYLSPRSDSSGGTEPEASTDTIAQRLAKIRSYETGCRVDLAEHIFSSLRTPVAKELIRIAKLGCRVRIVYGPTLTQPIYDILHGVKGVTMRGYYDGRNSDKPITIHSKYIRIRANYDGRHRDMVLTGSHNLSGPALRQHDEILVGLDQPAVARQYGANFAMLWRRAECVNVPDDVVCEHDA